MPTRSRPARLNSLPTLRSDHENDLAATGISIKGNDMLKPVPAKSSKPYSNPPSTPRIQIATPTRPHSSEEQHHIKHVEEASWRPASAVRRLGDIAVPTVEESTADILEMTRSSRMMKRENSEVDNIKHIFAGIMSGDFPRSSLPKSSSVPIPSTRSVACSPLSNWSCMSEDLLEHVSQRIATEQQMSLPPRSSNRSRPMSALSTGSRPGSRVSLRDHIVSPQCLSGVPSTQKESSRASSTRKRPLSARPGSSRSGRPGTAQIRNSTLSRPASSTGMTSSAILSYRDSLSETGISLPQKAVDRLVSSFEKEKLSADTRPCSRMSRLSLSRASSYGSAHESPLYLLLRQKVHQGFHDMVDAFEVYDKTKDGVINREDFSRVLSHFTIGLTKRQIVTLLKRSDLVEDWENNKVPYKTFLKKYLERGHTGYIKHCADLEMDRPQSGDTGLANLAEARLFAQLHSDFVDVLENFRSHDKEDSGCIDYADFKNVMSYYGLKVPQYRDNDRVNYVDYLNSVAQIHPTATGTKSSSRPQTAPANMALSHVYTESEKDQEVEFQQLSLNLRPVHKDPRSKALVKLENCKLIKGGARRPRQQASNMHGQIARKFGGNSKELRRAMQYYDTGRDGHIAIGTFRDLLSEFNIKVDENEFYNVVNTYDTSFRGLLPYKKILSNQGGVNA